MKENAERSGAMWAKKGDVRVTPFGKFLRHSRLDEIPQFINILKSDLQPAASACSWSAVGESIFEQVDLTIVDLQVKETYCPETLRGYWLSSQLSPAGQLEEIPFADSIAQLKVKQM